MLRLLAILSPLIGGALILFLASCIESVPLDKAGNLICHLDSDEGPIVFSGSAEFKGEGLSVLEGSWGLCNDRQVVCQLTLREADGGVDGGTRD